MGSELRGWLEFRAGVLARWVTCLVTLGLIRGHSKVICAEVWLDGIAHLSLRFCVFCFHWLGLRPRMDKSDGLLVLGRPLGFYVLNISSSSGLARAMTAYSIPKHSDIF